MHRVSMPLIMVWLLFLAAGESALAQPGERNIGRAGSTALFDPLADTASPGNAGLFVGVNRFTRDEGLNELTYAVHDAIELAHLFVHELKLIPASNCYLLLSGEPSADSVRQHLAQLRAGGAKVWGADRSRILLTFLDLRRAATKDENLFVCTFSSHGFNEGRTAYVMPSDGHRELLSETAVPLETIETKMEDSKAGHRLLLVDACQERVSARGSTSAGKAAEAAFIDALKKESGQAKLASCSPGEFSFEHRSLGGVGHGVFTYSFLEALRGGAKSDRENLVRLGPVADYVAARVTAWTKQAGRRKQTPFLESPVAAKQLPLAIKADDLTTLIASVSRAPLTGGLTKTLRDRLVKALPRVNPALAADREFLATTRDFVNGRMRPRLFLPYAERELDRLLPPVFEGTKTGEVRDDNAVKMPLVWCPPGRFTMGSPPDEEDRDDDEDQVEVTLTQGFWMGKHEVTVGQVLQWLNAPGVSFEEKWIDLDSSRCPVRRSGRGFVRNTSTEFGESDDWEYTLPTEAQWEYACRAGTTTATAFGDSLSSQYANFDGDYPYNGASKGPYLGKTTSVGSYRPNGWGLHDMHGNVYEWCRDTYVDTLPGGTDPLVDDSGSLRVSRGGCWSCSGRGCRSAIRLRDTPGNRFNYLGFRLAAVQSR